MNTYKKIIGKIAGNIMVKKVTLVLCLFCIMLGFGGMTYGYFKGVVTGGPGKQITATTANLSIVFNDGDAFTVEDMFPGETATKTFTVTNTGDREAKYSINWNTLTNGMTDKSDWTYVITSTNGGGTLSETQIPNSGTHINIIWDIWIDAGVTQTYTITFKFKNEVSSNQDDNRGKSITGKLEIIEQQIENTGAFLKNKLMKNATIANSPTTTPGRQIASTDEGLIKGPVDEYGSETYYFRGNVQNNYVSFAGKTWRIVRINGDGSIRLILNSNTGTSSRWGSSSSYSTSTYNTMIGWITYTNSPIKTNLENWYNSNLGNNMSYYSLIATGKFCSDKSHSGTSRPINFGGYTRLYSTSGASPQFTCPNSEDLYNLNIGTISADEVAFAGGIRGTTNTNYFLRLGSNYWTMTPYNWTSTGTTQSFYVNTNGSMTYYRVSSSYGVRPVINLKKDTSVTLDSDVNPGTSSNPYRVVLPDFAA